MIITSRRSFLGGLASLLAAPAIVHADSLMPVRSIERLISRGDFTFDSFDGLAPIETQYQWISKTVMGEPSGMIEQAIERGWKYVPVSRHAAKFAITRNVIEHGGQVLMERPVAVSTAARANEIAQARRLITEWATDIDGEGFDGRVRTSQGDFKFKGKV